MDRKKVRPELMLLYEDDDILAIGKPSGISVVAERSGEQEINLMSIVHQNLSPDYFNIHRLDKEASGILLLGKNRKIITALTRLFETREIEKTYKAITCSGPGEDKGEITTPLQFQPGRRKSGHHKDKETGVKSAETEYEVGERFSRGYTLMNIHPRTGRTHQIRIHLAQIGCPIVGDHLYGDGKYLYLSSIKRGYKTKNEEERPLIGRLALHAESISFTHPSGKKLITIKAPLPKDFILALKYLRKFA